MEASFPLQEVEMGEHTVEVRVIDETPWVLWDPEDLLSETVKWKVTVPESEGD